MLKDVFEVFDENMIISISVSTLHIQFHPGRIFTYGSMLLCVQDLTRKKCNFLLYKNKSSVIEKREIFLSGPIICCSCNVQFKYVICLLHTCMQMSKLTFYTKIQHSCFFVILSQTTWCFSGFTGFS